MLPRTLPIFSGLSVFTPGLLALLVLATAPQARAQGSIYDRPTVSPYLNLTQLGNSGALNYFTQVLPQFRQQQAEFRTNSQLQSLSRSFSTNSRSNAQGQSNQRRVTGHPTRFGYYGSYYQALNRGG